MPPRHKKREMPSVLKKVVRRANGVPCRAFSRHVVGSVAAPPPPGLVEGGVLSRARARARSPSPSPCAQRSSATPVGATNKPAFNHMKRFISLASRKITAPSVVFKMSPARSYRGATASAELRVKASPPPPFDHATSRVPPEVCLTSLFYEDEREGGGCHSRLITANRGETPCSPPATITPPFTVDAPRHRYRPHESMLPKVFEGSSGKTLLEIHAAGKAGRYGGGIFMGRS